MPAYYDLVFTYDRKAITPDTLSVFYSSLIKAGAEFAGGISEYSSLSLDTIIRENCKKLIDNFELGYEEHCSNDYKQAVFKLEGFSEARVFILNNWPTEGEYSIVLIVPESEVCNGYSSGKGYKFESVQRLIGLAKSVMRQTGALLVQTELEIYGEIISYDEFKNTGQISAYPFALVPKEFAGYADNKNFKCFIDSELTVICDNEYNLTERT